MLCIGVALEGCRTAPPAPEPRPASAANAGALAAKSDAYIKALSVTTLAQVQFAPDSAHGSRLLWVLVTRADTHWFAKPLDIEVVTPRKGFLGWLFRIAGFDYTLAYNGRGTLLINEKEIDLSKHTVVFLTVDPGGKAIREIRAGPFVSFVSNNPQRPDEVERLFRGMPEVRQFSEGHQ